MAKQYADRDALERELTYEAHDVGLSATEFNALCNDALQAATERIDAWVDDGYSWSGTTDAPATVKEEVIRLARARVARILEAGLESETQASGAAVEYRPPEDLYEDVKRNLRDMGYRSFSGSSRHVTSTNFSDS